MGIRDSLKKHGASFRHVRDRKGALAIDFGVYGVPETFVINQQGIISHKWIGPIVGEVYTNIKQNIIMPLLNHTSPVT